MPQQYLDGFIIPRLSLVEFLVIHTQQAENVVDLFIVWFQIHQCHQPVPSKHTHTHTHYVTSYIQ